MRIKILTLGEIGVGKTCMIKRYQYAYSCSHSTHTWNKQEEDFSTRYVPTAGVDFIKAHKIRNRMVNNKKVRIVANFFDLSGSPQYLKVRSEFYQDHHAAILVFDVTDRLSFERMDFWLKEVNKFGEGNQKFKCIVCGNKVDLESKRKVSEKEARNWAIIKGFEYFDTSAKTGYGIETMVDFLIKSTEGDTAECAPFTRDTQRTTRQEKLNSTAPAASTAKLRKKPSDMSVKELKNQLTKMGVSHSHCLEKQDLLFCYTRALEVAEQKRRDELEIQRKKMEEAAKKKEEEMIRDKVIKEIKAWAKPKDIRKMLNHVHGWKEGHPNHLKRQSSVGTVSRAYKKALLKIHPDKHDYQNFEQHLRATEMFKTVNGAYEVFKENTQ